MIMILLYRGELIRVQLLTVDIETIGAHFYLESPVYCKQANPAIVIQIPYDKVIPLPISPVLQS